MKFLCGDFNRLDLEDVESDCGLFVLDSPPTRGTARLDLVFTDRPDLINEVSTFTSEVQSDHLGLIVKPKLKMKPKREKRSFRLFSFRGHQRLHTFLSNFDFTNLYRIQDIDEAAEWLDYSIYGCFDNAFPTKQVRISDQDPYWFTPQVKWLINQKKQAKRRRNHKKMQEFDRKIGALKSRLTLRLSKCCSKSWWKGIDTITHRRQTSNKICTSAFEPHQLNVELSLRSTIRDNTTRQPPDIKLDRGLAPQLSIREVFCVLKKCKNSSAGPSNIPHFIFREYWDILVPLYHHLWNRSLEEAVFPKCYKVANLLPIPKVKCAKQADEIRGVSITSLSARLFERTVHRKWISRQITSLGDPYQFAYKQGLSTIDCLLCLQHYVLFNLDKKEIDGVHAILVDYSKAFDRVNQEKAAEQYNKFIESPHLRKWLYDFSTNRKQRLIWADTTLPYQSVDRGCSQGTVGGPALFSMYTDDCKATDQTSCIFKYSDDMNCLSLCLKQPSNEQKKTLDREKDNLLEYAKNKELDINMEKSKEMRFCLNRNPSCECASKNNSFESIEEAKILGITFQTDCSFRKFRLVYLLKDLKLQNVSSTDIHIVFDSLIVSRIRYGLSVYGSDTHSLKRIDKFLDRCFQKKIVQLQYLCFNFASKKINAT